MAASDLIGAVQRNKDSGATGQDVASAQSTREFLKILYCSTEGIPFDS